VRRAVRAGLALLALAATACPGPEPPVVRVVDETRQLRPEERDRIVDYLRFVREERGIDFRVVVAARADDAEAPELAALDRYVELAAGSQNEGRGLLLWLEPKRALARVEVGYALEPLLTDLAASDLVTGFLAPRFDEERLGPAVEAAIEGLVEELRVRRIEAEEAALPVEGAGGAGATVDVAEPPPSVETDDDWISRLAPQPTPEAARRLELEMLHRGLYVQDAALYDEAWRVAKRPGRWSPARLRAIADEWDRPFEVLERGDRAVAVVRDPVAVGPTLFLRDADGWRIDATAGARLVVYNLSNDGWFFIDEPGTYLDLVREAFPLERVRLRDGRAAWTRTDAP